ncbi:MAG: glycerol-3-phosphate dehydrogenase [Rhodospirillales bacterium]|nr:glycerol-3-phosphate dehydrogenase [Rhodospirillales bacterium]
MPSACDYDLCVVGGGINGAGIARDAAGRGLRVVLLEKGDLACATSSASSKLIHGGLRYLENFEIRLVRESLAEREILLKIAPHIVWPLSFVLPCDPTMRPRWMIRLGLFLYDRMAGTRSLPASRAIDLTAHPYGAPLSHGFHTGFVYPDCWVDDSRLVVLNAVDAARHGASILTRTACIGLSPLTGAQGWSVRARTTKGETLTFSAEKIVNATGPWVRDFLDSIGRIAPDTPPVRRVQGSHIVIPKLHDGAQAYILQQPDGRIVFALPFLGDFTLLGTTERDFSGDPGTARISQEETDYLCAAALRAFGRIVKPSDIAWSFSGVRPLATSLDGAARKASRDYVFHLNERDGPEILSVFGGKLTTYRRLAESALARLFPETQPWTNGPPLPGGDIGPGGFEGFLNRQAALYPFLPAPLLWRYARSYGTRMDCFLDGTQTLEDLGKATLAPDLYDAEVRYLREHEFARTDEDILFRRTKCGVLHGAPFHT